MGSNIAFSSDESHRLPTVVASREKMLPSVPDAKAVLKQHGAADLMEMILGEDA